ncbi:uncharacterized protein LOC120015312 [Tripterygium wilfordii]|uniref:uncharacterized protein LOC120015312 n=1 Tax=Tripterygium wilfordii TaxID=458696 RepID=UPI0018F7EFF8|nr:uncharacterized protein LOC120015312 [Tripterygium wilfordii]
MGMLPGQPEPCIQHFSHPHHLQLSNYDQTFLAQTLSFCSCCKLKVSGWIYTCIPCNFFLDISCSKMPQQITHPFDQNHVLYLLSSPAYPQGFFCCDACGKQGNGFSYHCGVCNIDLHTQCASMPLLVTHQAHQHQLQLTFSPPYYHRNFSCDLCKNLGSNQWVYRCNSCDFDAHLSCATAKPRAPTQQRTPIVSPQHQVPLPQMATNYSPFRSNTYPNGFGPSLPIGGGVQGNALNQTLLGGAGAGAGAGAGGGGGGAVDLLGNGGLLSAFSGHLSGSDMGGLSSSFGGDSSF